MKNLFIYTFMILGFFSFVQAKEISLYTFMDYQEQIEKIEEEEILPTSIFSNIQKRRCISYEKDDYILTSPACFFQKNDLPKLSFIEAIDILIPYIDDVAQIYDTTAKEFTYTGTALLRKKKLPSLSLLITHEDKFLLGLLGKYNILIKIPKVLLAQKQIEEYMFFASVRETNTYGKCRKQNYNIAMEKLDGFLLKPDEDLNMNKLISNLPGYCKGDSGKYLFYQGVCGSSTQLFWNALVNPYLNVKERHNHGEFWINFYGNMGEDAGIYEMSKQLVLENKTNNSIYFKTFVRESDGNTVLLSVYPKDEGLISQIKKKDTGKLSAELRNTIRGNDNAIISEVVRKSKYRGVNKTKD